MKWDCHSSSISLSYILMPKNNIYDLSEAELSEWVIAHDLKPYTATQLIDWLYGKRVSSFEEMTNLSKAARAALQDAFEIRRLQEARRHVSTDGSVKFGFQLADGEVIESVLMPQKNRITLCLSSQVGCAMGCGFCKTAEMKLKRNLSQGEILGQVLAAMDFLDLEAPETQHLKSAAGQERVSNIVFMGMGEPLHNLDPVVAAVRILIDPKAFHLSHNKVVVSTSGLAPQIRQFAAAVPAKLAVSLNATNDALRTKIMPINRRYDLKEVIAACQDYARIHGSGVTFEYVLLKDVNDTPEHAAA